MSYNAATGRWKCPCGAADHYSCLCTPEDVKDVHIEHCCHRHGCKYGKEQCSVTTGHRIQSHPCAECDEEIEGVWETAHLINDMITRERDAFVESMWDLYLRACGCHMDYHSLCGCAGNEIAENELRRLLGKDWHKICRERFNKHEEK